VRIDVADGVIAAVAVDASPTDATVLPGLTLPGFANAHSHAFHRGLRGRTHAGTGTFFTWRERMYELAGRLDPDTYHALARAAFAEMALAGITAVGEFHYLHHGPGGRRYADPNEMGHRLLAAAAEAGIRITLLDTLYLTGGVDGRPLEGPQLRFGDGSVDAWSERVDAIKPGPHGRLGAAAHSVRAVPAAELAELARRTEGMPVHVHLSEQPAENDECRAAHAVSPTGLLERCGLVGEWVTAVHATHVDEADRRILGRTRTSVCLCPTTERDLADGIGPAREMAEAGVPLCLGSDSHAIIDPLEEARAVEMDERLSTRRRGHFTASALLSASSIAGHAALGWPDAGVLAPGARADLVTVALDTARTAGFDPADPVPAVVFGAGAGDVRSVIVDGRLVVRDGVHSNVDVPRALADAIAAVWR
jgi:formiminoglutamate deiminase